MKITFAMHGKPKDKRILEIMEEYRIRIGRYQKIDFLFINDYVVRTGRGSFLEKFLEKVGTLGKQIFILDEDGKQLSTQDFSYEYEKNLNSGVKEIVFAIGPAEGWGDINVGSSLVADELKSKNVKFLSLSKMAMQHDIAALVLVEQIYRAVSIKNNLPYHK